MPWWLWHHRQAPQVSCVHLRSTARLFPKYSFPQDVLKHLSVKNHRLASDWHLQTAPFTRLSPLRGSFPLACAHVARPPYLPPRLLGRSTSAPAPLSLSAHTRRQPENSLWDLCFLRRIQRIIDIKDEGEKNPSGHLVLSLCKMVPAWTFSKYLSGLVLKAWSDKAPQGRSRH